MEQIETKERWFRREQLTAPLLVIFVAAMLEIGNSVLKSGSLGSNVYFTVSVVQIVAYLFPCALYYIIKGRKLATPVLISPVKISHILFIVFSFMLFMSGTILIKYFVYIANGSVTGMTGYYTDVLASSGDDSLGIIMAVIILPAVCEEMFFRGVLLAEYRSAGSVNAVIITALCFAMLHFSLKDFFIYFFAGLVLGFVASATRSVVASIIIHAGANALALLGSDTYIRLTIVKCGTFFVGFVLTTVFAVSLLLSIARLESLYYRYAANPPSDELPPRSLKGFAGVFFSPTFIVTVALFFILTIYV